MLLIPTAEPFFYSRHDPVVNSAGGLAGSHREKILAALGSAGKALDWGENRGHILSRDLQHALIFRDAGKYTVRIAQGTR